MEVLRFFPHVSYVFYATAILFLLFDTTNTHWKYFQMPKEKRERSWEDSSIDCKEWQKYEIDKSVTQRIGDTSGLEAEHTQLSNGFHWAKDILKM